jgi:hypothetical protein
VILIRNVTKDECPWLDTDLPEGLEVHKYSGCTYGCIGAGIAVTREPGQTPFFEVPRDAVGSPSHPEVKP